MSDALDTFFGDEIDFPIPAELGKGLPGKLTLTGLELQPGLSYQTWECVIHQLSVMDHSIPWWLGDALNYGERSYGEMYAQAMEATKFKYSTLKNYKYTASHVEKSLRKDNLGFHHHLAVASLPPDQQKEWLDKAIKNEWSVSQLREEIETPTEDIPPMPDEEGKYDGNEWYTPADYIEAARSILGTFDIDPASCAYAQKTIQAAVYFDKDADGLSRDWPGRVWLNPPYSYPEVEHFTGRLIEQFDAGITTEAILLVNNCTDAEWFQKLLKRYPICLTAGRIRFERPDFEKFATRQGQAFFYLGPGEKTDSFREVFSQFGTIAKAI